MRKTNSEDMRMDVLRAAGCSHAIAERLIEEHGSVAEVAGLNAKELSACNSAVTLGIASHGHTLGIVFA